MNKDVFNSKLYEFMTKLSQLVIVSMLWLFTSIPIITIGASNSALYYTVVKVIRNETGTVPKQYFKAFKTNFIPCLLPGILIALYAFIMIMDFYSYAGKGYYALPRFVWIMLICCFVMFAAYLFPVISRFQNTLPALIRISIMLMIKHLNVSFQLFLLALAALVVTWFFLPCAIVIPGLVGYLASYRLEDVLRECYPPDTVTQ